MCCLQYHCMLCCGRRNPRLHTKQRRPGTLTSFYFGAVRTYGPAAGSELFGARARVYSTVSHGFQELLRSSSPWEENSIRFCGQICRSFLILFSLRARFSFYEHSSILQSLSDLLAASSCQNFLRPVETHDFTLTSASTGAALWRSRLIPKYKYFYFSGEHVHVPIILQRMLTVTSYISSVDPLYCHS